MILNVHDFRRHFIRFFVVVTSFRFVFLWLEVWIWSLIDNIHCIDPCCSWSSTRNESQGPYKMTQIIRVETIAMPPKAHLSNMCWGLNGFTLIRAMWRRCYSFLFRQFFDTCGNLRYRWSWLIPLFYKHFQCSIVFQSDMHFIWDNVNWTNINVNKPFHFVQFYLCLSGNIFNI